jgi:hypothetical protein
VILLASYIVLFISKLIFRVLKREVDSKHQADLIVIALSLSLCAILLRSAIHVSPAIIIILIAVCVFAARSKLKNTVLNKISVIFAVLTIVSVSGLFLGVSKAENPVSEWSNRNKEHYDQIKFTRKPNVYLIITESYPNKEALGKIYNFDNRFFYEKLEELKFTLHHKYYSNYNHTLASLPSLFGMAHHYYSINIGNFDSIGGRSMLEATTYNPVIEIFRQNDYEIQYLLSVDSLLPRGASVDYFSPSPPVYSALEIFLSHQDSMKKSIFSFRKFNFMQILAERFSKNAASGVPTFSFIYTNTPHHSPSRIKSRNRAEINKILETFRQGYSKSIQNANAHLLKIVELILNNDRDPIIMITGDHGPWGYRLKEDGSSKTIPDSLFALDRFGILMAIRFPEAYQQQYDNDFKTHVNLFRIVFSFLSDSKQILNMRVNDDSIDYGPNLAIRDGRILDKYLAVKVGN